MRNQVAWVGSLVTLLASAAPRLLAQADCFPDPSSNEAKTFAIKSVALAYAPLAAPTASEAGRVRLALETSYVPSVDDATATPTICRPGKGPENANLLAVMVRPRIALELPAGFVLDASWVPPVRVAEAKANLIGVALSRATVLTETLVLSVRGHGTFGRIRAPITCPEEGLADPESECYQGTESNDRYDPNIVGADLALGLGRADSRLRPYLGVGYNRLLPRFQVNFTNAVGQLDERKVSVDLNRGVVFGGAAWAASDRVGLVGEVYAAPSDAITGRLLVQASLR